MSYPFKFFFFLLPLALLASCGEGKQAEQREESLQAKRMMQGVWMDAETESIVFKMQGDSVYYPDSTSMPAYFKIIDDTLYVGATARYGIEKHTEHLLWFRNPGGELVKLVRDDDSGSEEVFEHNKPQILTLTEVLKRDTVVFWNAGRYHLYIAVNPTRYKVTRHTLNADGLDVENVYFDNIIHLSIYKGNVSLFSRDFRKQHYQQRVPEPFLQQAVLNDMQFVKVDAAGFHVSVSLCTPGDASCYLIEHVIDYNGRMTTKLQEY